MRLNAAVVLSLGLLHPLAAHDFNAVMRKLRKQAGEMECDVEAGSNGIWRRGLTTLRPMLIYVELEGRCPPH
jgi:hypothetical protein